MAECNLLLRRYNLWALCIKGAMMKHRKILFTILVTLLILACNIPTPTPVGTTATPTSTVILPTATFTPVGSTVPFAVPNDGPLNCRSGPGTNYQVVVVLGGTQSAEIVGKTPDAAWWYVKNPYLAGNFCWVISTFVNTSGNVNSVQVVAVPATPTNAPNPVSVVTAIEMSIDPETIHIAGCIGPAQPITVTARIQANGPMQIKVHFRDELAGDLGTQTVNFTIAGAQDVSDSFTPQVVEGRHRIFLEIEGMDLSDMNARKPYEITC